MDPSTSTLAIGVCIAVVICFGLWALYLSFLNHRVHKSADVSNDEDVDFFITARNSQSASTIGWSLYAASVGAWVLFVPSAFCVDPIDGAGWLGLINYSVFSGLPILLIASTGKIIKEQHPSARSIGDFVSFRYGRGVEVYVSCLVFVNTGKFVDSSVSSHSSKL
jgi:hypothetical protein